MWRYLLRDKAGWVAGVGLGVLLMSWIGVTAVDDVPAHQSPIAEGAKLQKLAGGFTFTEGPASDAEGNVFFSDQPNNRICKWDTAGKLTTWMQPCGRANGMCFDEHGNLITCSDEHNQLWSITPDQKVTVLIKNYDHKLLNGPNDVWVRPGGGGIYITDPMYWRDYWTRPPEQQDKRGVYFLSPDGKALTRVVDDLKQPNGIIGTPSGKRLYISDIDAKQTWSYIINDDGSLADKKLFCSLGSDGMTIDSEGNVYLTGHGVTIFDPTGQQIDHIDVDEKWTGNVCFGGKDKHLLFITASTGIYGMQMRTKGVGSQ